MLAIGERINGMFRDVRRAIQKHDKGVIQDWALRQAGAGADVLDLNVGPAAEDAAKAMVWLVESVREVTAMPLSIDSTRVPAIRAGLEAAGKGSIINSTTAAADKVEALFPLAAEHGCSIIGLTINEAGVPRDSDARLEVALTLVAAAMEYGIPTDKLLIDPVILPVNAIQHGPMDVFKTIGMCHALADPAPKTVLGLSNVSQGATKRSLLNRTCLVMALAYGLDAAIVDVNDEALMEAVIAAEVLANRAVYCDDFVAAYLASRRGR